MKVYFLEDEILIQKHIIKILEQIPFVQVVGFSGEIAKALKEIPELKPELVLADIRLKDGDSFELFSNLEKIDFQIVFLTAYDEYAIQALNLGAVSYLLKPIQEETLLPILEKCFKQKQQEKFEKQQLNIAQSHYHGRDPNNPKRIALKSLEYIEIVLVEDIIYCKSDKGYTTFFLSDNREILVSKGLKEYDELLEPWGFVRCHQSYLVNIKYVKKYYKEGYLQLVNLQEIPVSSRKRDEIMNSLENM